MSELPDHLSKEQVEGVAARMDLAVQGEDCTVVMLGALQVQFMAAVGATDSYDEFSVLWRDWCTKALNLGLAAKRRAQIEECQAHRAAGGHLQ